MGGVTYDTGALIAAERASRPVWALHRRSAGSRRWHPPLAVRCGQRVDADGLPVAHVEQVRVGGREHRTEVPGDLSGDAVSQADRASGAVAVARSEPSRTGRGRRIAPDGFEQAELGEVERSLVLVRSDDADEMIEHLGDPDQREGRPIVGLEQRSDLDLRAPRPEESAHDAAEH